MLDAASAPTPASTNAVGGAGESDSPRAIQIIAAREARNESPSANPIGRTTFQRSGTPPSVIPMNRLYAIQRCSCTSQTAGAASATTASSAPAIRRAMKTSVSRDQRRLVTRATLSMKRS